MEMVEQYRGDGCGAAIALILLIYTYILLVDDMFTTWAGELWERILK